MSVDSCASCGKYVDTDFDSDGYTLQNEDCKEMPLDFFLCEGCRTGEHAFHETLRLYHNKRYEGYLKPEMLTFLTDEIKRIENQEQKDYERSLHEAGSGV